jgi:hypothetical protein
MVSGLPVRIHSSRVQTLDLVVGEGDACAFALAVFTGAQSVTGKVTQVVVTVSGIRTWCRNQRLTNVYVPASSIFKVFVQELESDHSST